jgi:hypothetical protein
MRHEHLAGSPVHGGTAGWSACASHPFTHSRPRSRKAFPRSFVDVYEWVVCAKTWQLARYIDRLEVQTGLKANRDMTWRALELFLETRSTGRSEL